MVHLGVTVSFERLIMKKALVIIYGNASILLMLTRQMIFPKFMPLLAVNEEELGIAPEHTDQACAPMHVLL